MTLYASTTQIKAALRIPSADSVDDTLINMAGSAASEMIDSYTGRTFGTVAATRYYNAGHDYVLDVDDLAGTAITVATSSNGDGVWDTTWTTTDYQLEPLNGIADGMVWPYTRLRAVGDYLWPTVPLGPTVKITGTFGFPAIPAAVVHAAVITGSRLFKRFESPLGVLGGNDFGVVRVSRSVDPDVAILLDPYRKHLLGVA